MKICVVTFHGEVEPRGPRHAIAAKQAFPDATVEFVHHRAGVPRPEHADVPMLRGHDIRIKAMTFPTRASDAISLAKRRITTRAARLLFRGTGMINEAMYGDRCQGLTRTLIADPADVYFAHNIETLLPAARAAAHHRAALMFDCMEYYSDMGADGQPPVVSKATHALEARWLPVCKLVVASSNKMADALAAEYGIARPLPAYNAAPKLAELPPRNGGGLNLYWRNFVLGFGHRGLQDAFAAISQLPPSVRLFIQGSLPADGGAALNDHMRKLGIADRVTLLPPHGLGEAVQHAARYDVGLCLEHASNRNHELTVSNKMFDYLMGGLAVVASDLPGLASVVHRSGGGVVYEPGNGAALAAAIGRLNDEPTLLAELQRKARSFAMTEGNREVEIDRVAVAMRHALA